MKKYRIIFHVDLNAFYASCEMAHDPSLKDKPIGIGHQSDRGILTTANYVARKYGVTSAMRVFDAKRLCPKLKVLPANFALYKDYSERFFDYLKTKTSVIEPASIDEAYMDMTDTMDALSVAKTIQEDLLKQLDLPVSIGIAPNMFLAKMASDMKKPLGITVLRKRDVIDKLWPLPIASMHGIGKKTVPNLRLLGIETIGDLAQYQDIEKLRHFLGNNTEIFIEKANGNCHRAVDTTRQDKHQSIGNSRTYESLLTEEPVIIEALEKLTRRVIKRLQDEELVLKTITVQMRTADFVQKSRSFSLPYHTNNFYEVFTEVERLFDTLYDHQPIALLGVSSSNLEKSESLFEQLTIFDKTTNEPTNEQVTKLLKSINDHYQKPMITQGIKVSKDE